jgi:hypothetical protein
MDKEVKKFGHSGHGQERSNVCNEHVSIVAARVPVYNNIALQRLRERD